MFTDNWGGGVLFYYAFLYFFVKSWIITGAHRFCFVFLLASLYWKSLIGKRTIYSIFSSYFSFTCDDHYGFKVSILWSQPNVSQFRKENGVDTNFLIQSSLCLWTSLLPELTWKTSFFILKSDAKINMPIFSCCRSLQKRSLNGYPTKMHFLLLKHLLTYILFNPVYRSTKRQPQCLSTAQAVATVITAPTALPF